MLQNMSTPEILAISGIVSGVLSLLAYMPYILDTWRGTTQPQRASWLIWSVLSLVAFSSQAYEGATHSLWFAGVQAGGTLVVFLLSIKRGVGGFASKTDCLILLVAAAGLALWYMTETAAYALAITISISLLGGSVTVLKAYRDPSSETLITWALSFLAACFALVSVGKFDPVLLAYPLYLFILNGAIVLGVAFGASSILRSQSKPMRAAQPA